MSWRFPAALIAAGLCALAGHSTASAQGACAPCAQPATHHCPPAYRHVAEGPPKIKIKQGCPRPVCDPCHLDHYGYFPTCWSPWPHRPNYHHCPVPHTGAVLPPPAVSPFAPRPYRPTPPGGPALREPELEPLPKRPTEPLPPPRKLEDRPTVRLLRHR